MGARVLPVPRLASWSDLPRLRDVLAGAYAEDPLMAWTFPGASTRADSVAAWLGLFLEASLEAESVDVVDGDDGRVVALAAWRAPGTQPSATGMPTVAGLLTALVGAEHATRVGSGLAALRPHVPTRPAAYLQLLAVDPVHQGRGLGGRVLQPGLDRAAGDLLRVHLETANPRSIAFYSARGLAVVAEVDLPGGGPRLSVLTGPPDVQK